MENQYEQIFTQPQQPLPPAKPSALAFSRIGLALAMLVLVQQVVATILVIIVQAAAPAWLSSDWFGWVSSYLPLYLAGFPVLLAILHTVPATPTGPVQLHRVGPWGLARLFMACVTLFYSINLLTVLLNEWSGAGMQNTAADMMLGSNPWVNLFFACAVAPVMEEIIFRQMLYKRLAGYGGKVYILFSGLMFGLLHPNIFQFFYATLLGMVFAAVRHFTGKLWPSIALHVGVNFLGSGLPVLLVYYSGDENALMGRLMIFTFVEIGLAVAGLAVIIHWLAAGRKAFALEQGPLPAPRARATILNPGVLIYIVFFVLLIVITVIMPMLAPQ